MLALPIKSANDMQCWEYLEQIDQVKINVPVFLLAVQAW